MTLVMVTGSKGYIGTNLIPFLIDKGFEVVCYDKKSNQDILNINEVKKKMKGCKYVYHCAAISGVKACEKNPWKAFQVNLIGTKNIVDVAEQYNAKVILFSSFAAKTPTENNLLSYYGTLKRLLELLFKDKAVILKMANIFGGKKYIQMKPNNFIPHVCTDNPIQIHHGGKQTRDFTHINSVMDWCLKAQTLPYGIYEVCTNHQTPIETIAFIASTIRGVPVEYKK